jgi:uncharacterized membrane protein
VSIVRNVLLFLHIAAAIILLGSLIFMDMVTPGLVRGGRDNLPILRKFLQLGRVFGPSASIVFLVGIALVIRGEFQWGDLWISASMLLFIVAAVLGAVPHAKTLETAISKLNDGHPADAEASRLSMLGGVNILIVLVIVYLMVAKPGLSAVG